MNYTKAIRYNPLINSLIKNYYIKNKLYKRYLKIITIEIKIFILTSLIKDKFRYKKSIEFFIFKTNISKSLYLLKLLSFSKYKLI